jgi:hypothetical protein
MGYAVPADWWGMLGADVVAAGSTAPPVFDFSASNGGNKSVVRGGAAVTNTVTATLSSGTSEAVTFSAAGQPAGVTASFTTPMCTPTCSTTLTLTADASAALGTSTVTVTAAAASVTHTTAFSLTVTGPPPTVTSVTPASGPTSGGTTLTITGTGFVTGATVSVGGSAATGVTVVDSTTLTATTPAHAAGAVSLAVTIPGGQSATMAAAFTYVGPAPAVTSVTPASGSTGGGTGVTITGSNFASGATVTIGGAAATAVTVVNGTTITASTPAHAAGAVSVTVTNADGQSGTVASGFTYTAPAGVAVDAVGPAAAGMSVSNASTMSWSHTVTATGANRLLTVGVAVGKNPDSGTALTVTYGGVPMTSAGIVHANNGTAGYAQLFYLLAPAPGPQTVQVTLTGGAATSIEGGSVSFTGVDQATPFRNLVTSVGNSASPRVTVASAAGDMVVDVMVSGCNGTTTSTQTLRWLKTVNCSTAGGNGAQSTAAGAASVTMGYTVRSDWWGMIAMDLVAR